jgi:hypothetical protein
MESFLFNESSVLYIPIRGMSRRLYKLVSSSVRRYMVPMQRRFAFATTTTTPGFPGAVGLRVV